jgi:putative DNA primase/helicase
VFVIDAVKEKGKDGEEVSRSFNLKTDLTRLEAMLNEIGDVALIVIDPITAYLGNTDSHKNAEVRALLAPLGELAARHGGAVVCVSHLNKSGNSEALMCVTGSLAFVAAARAAYIVARDNDDPERRLFLPLKNNIGRDHSGLAFRVEGYHLPNGIATSRVVWEQDPVAITADEAMAPTSDPEAQTALDDAKEFLTGLLSQGPVAARRIFAEAKAASLSKRTICRAKTALGINPTKTGFDGGWEWSLP